MLSHPTGPVWLDGGDHATVEKLAWRIVAAVAACLSFESHNYPGFAGDIGERRPKHMVRPSVRAPTEI
jgi:hypothetical protein